MRTLVVITQWITFLLILGETWLVFKRMRNRAHYYLFMNSIALVVYGAGSLLMLFVETQEAGFIAFLLTWGGKIGTVISMLYFCIVFFEYKLPAVIVALESGSAVICWTLITTTKQTGLFCKELQFVKDNGLMIAEYQSGIGNKVWSITVIVIILTSIYMLLKSLVREKNKQRRRQFKVFLCALLLEFPIGLLTMLPIGKYFDFNLLGFLMIIILVLLSMFGNDFMKTEELAKDYIIDELSAGVIAMDKNETVAYYNKKALHIFPDLLQDEQGMIQQIEDSINTGIPIVIEDKVYTFEKRKLGQESSDESKIYVMIDATKQYQYLKEVEREKQIADAANRAKTDFLAKMSHEIRTPINAVLGMDEMILRECKDEIIRDYATDIRNAGQILLTIVNDILDLNKIESGKMEIVPVEYDMQSMIADVSSMIKLRAESHNLAFHVNISSEIPSKLFGDDVKLRQVLMNLLTNAVKYTSSGDVWLRVELRETIKSATGQDIILHVEVEDTGIGIKPEDKAKLFMEFERVNDEQIRGIEGTGLGLPIAMRLLSLMGSELAVKSEYGKGSVFSFDLKQKVVEEASESKQEDKVKDGEKKQYTQEDSFVAPDAHILLVDDNRINRKVFKNLIKEIQTRITEAESGFEAIDLAASQHFDIIFMDHMMPGMDGVEAMKNIRSKKEGPCVDTPIIVLTANAIEGSREMYMEAGFDGYLSKPLTTGEVLSVIAQHLAEKKIKTVEEILQAKEPHV